VEPSGPLQACNGTDLPFTVELMVWQYECDIKLSELITHNYPL